jgi:hypothetical protein
MRDSTASARASTHNGASTVSMPLGWEEMNITANEGDAEKKYYPVGQPITLKRYQEGTYHKLAEEGPPLGQSSYRHFALVGRRNSLAVSVTSPTFRA